MLLISKESEKAIITCSLVNKILKNTGMNNKGILMVKMLGATFMKDLRFFDLLHRLLTQSLNNEMLDICVCVCVLTRWVFISLG